MYHALKLHNNLVVRPVVDGITDIEWQHGCRLFEMSSSRYELETRIRNSDQVITGDVDLLSIELWREFVSSLDEPTNVPNNFFVNTFKRYDKWDTNRPIY